ncbi:MAG: DUF4388 domain-containing protein [Ktedonobacteraceae bacterium]
MINGRNNEAESLRDILALMRMRKQSGLLSVEHYSGHRYEEGEILIQGGHPTHAHTGQLTGQDALAYLLGWHQVYFTFLADEKRLPANISVTTPANNRNAIAVGASVIPLTPRSPQVTRVNTTENVPALSTKLPPVELNVGATSVGINDTMYRPNNPNTPGLEWLVPRKLETERDVLSLPLTRPQRSIYLLVDGHRTVADLSRCTRKSMQEIERLLIELQEQDLIAV